MYRLLADLIVLAHFAFVIFVVGGGLLVHRWPRVAWLHLPAALWGAAVEFLSLECPLTPLENRFRTLAGMTAYRGDFITQHLLPVLYPAHLTTPMQVVLGSLAVAVNAVVYGAAASRWRSMRRGIG